MNLRSTKDVARMGSRWALLALAGTVWLLSPAAQAQHMHGSGGGHRGGHIASAPNHFGGGHHRGFAPRGFHHHRNISSFVVIGGAGFLYPYAYPYYAYPNYPSYAYPTYAYPYGYDSSPATPAYFCDAAGVYYPYVTTCEGGWRVVPAPPGQVYPAPPQ